VIQFQKPGLWLALLLTLIEPVSPALAGNAHRIRFGNVDFDPVAEATRFRAAPETPEGKALRLIQFEDTPRQAWLDALAARGATVLQYYPGRAYLMWSDAAALDIGEASLPLRWVGDYSPDFKLAPDLVGRLGTIENVHLLVVDDGNLVPLQAQIEDQGAEVLRSFPAQPDGRIHSLVVRAHAGQLAAINALPQVVWAEYAAPQVQAEDETSAQVVAGNYDANGMVLAPGYIPFLNTLGLSGNGVTFAVTDSGIDQSNPEFSGRIAAGYDFPGCTPNGPAGNDRGGGAGHGTHVAGLLAGAGAVFGGEDPSGFHYGMGVAPQARLVAMSLFCAPTPPAGGWQAISKQALARGAIGTNNSWTSGEGINVGYNATARTHDFMVRDGDFDTPASEPFLIVFSAGNSGPGAGTLTAPKEAKNVISVGNSFGPRAGPIDLINSQSSRGPAVDGRLLPTLAAPGTQVSAPRRLAGGLCANPPIGPITPLSYYAFCTGTSMAAPHVSGTAALLVQHWRTENAGATPSPAMLKALLVNGAVDMAGPPPVPNAIEGWGRVHLPGSLGLGLERVTVDQSERFDEPGEVYERSYSVPASGEPIRVTLAWTDAPGAAGAIPALVNDLDLEVIAGGQLYRGNVYAAGQSTTGGTADRLDNLENVFLPAGVGGQITVRVRAHALPGDGVPGIGDATDQDFALVCTNCEAVPGFSVDVSGSAASLCAGEPLVRAVSLTPFLGYQQPVSLSASGVPAPGSVSFVPNPVLALPGSSALTVSTTGLPSGDYPLLVSANSAGIERTDSLGLFVASAPPSGLALSLPAEAAEGVPVDTAFEWEAAEHAYDYRVEIATDAEFVDLVDDAETRATVYTPELPLQPATEYFWRVSARNACPSPILFGDGFEGGGQPVARGRFTTAAGGN
jgi:subtilisin family serine protease